MNLPAYPLPAPSPDDEDVKPRFPLLLPGLVVMAWLWAFACLPAVTDTAVNLFEFCFLLPIGGLIALTWFGVGVALFRVGFGRVGRTRAVASWTLTAFALALVAGLTQTSLGLIARTALSERALLAHAATLKPEERADGPGWVGLFHVRRVERNGEAIALETAQIFIDWAGLLYLPPGTHPPSDWRVDGHLFGNWYRGHWHF